MTLRQLAVVLGVALALTGCTSASNDQAGPETTTATTTTATPTSASVGPACADVVAKAQALVTEAGRLATGNTTVDQVRTAATELSDAFDAAKADLGPDAQADLDQAGQALQRVQDALTTQPVDTAALRTATTDLLAALGDAAAICTPGSPTGTTDTTDTTAPTS